MNLILLLVLIAEACLGLCAWLSPDGLRWIAAHLLTRADVIAAARKEHSRRLEYWQTELRVGPSEHGEDVPGMSAVRAAFPR